MTNSNKLSGTTGMECLVCHGEFNAHNYNVRRGWGKFCSKVCMGSWFGKRNGQRLKDATLSKQVVSEQPDAYKVIRAANGEIIKVSNEDYEWVSGISWYVSKNGYPSACVQGKTTTMHSLMKQLIGVRGPQHLDHRYGDKLDNRREMLRSATNQENSFNSRPQNGRRFKGTTFARGAWRAQITFAGENHYLGTFSDEREAAAMYDAAAIQLFGDFAWLNLIGR